MSSLPQISPLAKQPPRGVATRPDLPSDLPMIVNPAGLSAALVVRWDRYLGLAPSLRQLLRLKSLIMPPATKSDFVECLRATGSRTADGKAWSAVSVNTWSDELRRQGLMTADHACQPAFLHLIAADAGASGDADALA